MTSPLDSTDVYAPPGTDPQQGLTPEGIQRQFYIVGMKKFFLLFFLTLGFYQVYWFYKHWRIQKDTYRTDTWPVARAIFSIFFAHSLFRAISAAQQQRDPGGGFAANAMATLYVGLAVVDRIVERFSRSSDFTSLDLISLGLVLTMIYPLSVAQRSANEACSDPDGHSNSSFTLANYLWCIPGVALWLGLSILLYDQLIGLPL